MDNEFQTMCALDRVPDYVTNYLNKSDKRLRLAFYTFSQQQQEGSIALTAVLS